MSYPTQSELELLSNDFLHFEKLKSDQCVYLSANESFDKWHSACAYRDRVFLEQKRREKLIPLLACDYEPKQLSLLQ